MTHFTRFTFAFLGFLTTSTLSAQPDWVVNPANFQYTMTITAVALTGCAETDDTSDIVAAFIDGEVRGVQRLDTDFQGRQFAFMVIFDHDFSGNEISFKIYDASEDSVLDALNTAVFTENQNLGDVDFPFAVQTAYAIDALQLTRDSIPEDAQAGTTVADLLALDANQTLLTAAWELVPDAQGPDNGYFSILNNALILNADLDPGLQDSYQIHVRGTSLSGCTLDSVIVLPVEGQGVSGLDPVTEEMGVEIFPNPAGRYVQLQVRTQVDLLRIYSARGELVYTARALSGTAVLDVSDWAPQLYWVTYQAGGVSRGYKLMVQR